MSFAIQSTPRGPSASWKGKQLASSYDSAREATAWAERVVAARGSLVFVAGDPWGLASQALIARGCKAVALVPGAQALPFVPPGLTCWAPGTDLERFLEDVLDAEGPDAVSWEVWPAFERLAPEVSLDWSRRFRDVYRLVQGSWMNQRRFGPRFWSNAVRNALDWEHPVDWTKGDRPVVIAASGPSLNDGLGVLARERSHFDLWALPSSFETLMQRGLRPDVGVATDGGYYAREHLHRLAGTVPLLASLSSAPDPSLARRPTLLFSQGLPIERALLARLGPHVAEVPSQGTVAVTALRWALEATTGPVFIAGLDLAFQGLRGHTSPHTVDRRLGPSQSRLQPAESQWAQRWLEQATIEMEGARTSPALRTYALWFRHRAQFSRRVFRIAPSAIRWDSMEEIDWESAALLWRTSGRSPVRWVPRGGGPDRERRRALVRVLLDDLRRGAAADPGQAWVGEACRSAVPEAWAEDLREGRLGSRGQRAPAAFGEFLAQLAEPLR